ncbi:hypothetical protein [Levilactobacillus wangkuiensis]|uniref:hypothetical protein n=1 Tax=Levilactobacillus wangkuiensis TaxID=2799566 RepID=UPI001942B7FD|nr:hypothetical protein [Levilactobacillus wangkuiensis]
MNYIISGVISFVVALIVSGIVAPIVNARLADKNRKRAIADKYKIDALDEFIGISFNLDQSAKNCVGSIIDMQTGNIITGDISPQMEIVAKNLIDFGNQGELFTTAQLKYQRFFGDEIKSQIDGLSEMYTNIYMDIRKSYADFSNTGSVFELKVGDGTLDNIAKKNNNLIDSLEKQKEQILK